LFLKRKKKKEREREKRGSLEISGSIYPNTEPDLIIPSSPFSCKIEAERNPTQRQKNKNGKQDTRDER